MLVILDEGPDREALEHQVQSVGLVGRIRLPGQAGNVSRWYRAARSLRYEFAFRGLSQYAH